MTQEKALLRKQYLRVRASIPREERLRQNAHFLSSVLSLPAFQSPDAALLCFASADKEADTREILRAAWDAGKRVALPRCGKRGEMAFYLVTSPFQLRSGAFGIDEPDASCQMYLPSETDLCIVPGVAFDRDGFRLGYGGGYYDRYLVRFPMQTVGLCFTQCLALSLPREPFDIPVQQVIC